ncbi:hypothetical protein HGQ82_06990 [Clostridioides difficile]|nr:hypothetical protein [Clostridioides difficile]
MVLSAKIFLGIILLIFVVLDIIVLVSLTKPGDERNQIIVWKASSYTLLVVIGVMILNVIQEFIGERVAPINPLIQLELTAIVYFIALMIFKKRHSV